MHEANFFVSADELLPLLILCIIRSQTPTIYLDLEYVQTYRNPSHFQGEVAYYFTHLLSALTYIEHLAIEILPFSLGELTNEFTSVHVLTDQSPKNTKVIFDLKAELAPLDHLSYRFAQVDVSDLRYGDIDALLQEYKLMASVFKKVKDNQHLF